MNKKTACSIENRVEQFREICREHDLKMTHQRLEIYRVIACSYDHPSAEDVYELIKNKLPTISLDTVYRTLSLFEQHGLISRVHHLDDRSRFDPNLEPHHHFICTRCKKVQDFYWDEFDELLQPVEVKKLGEVHFKKVELQGICKECQKRNK